MNATVRPFDGGAAHQVDDILKWMDSLAGRECSADEFLEEVLDRELGHPDLSWEVLALLEQYFRRKKIPHDVFVSLKARLQKQSRYLGNFNAPLLMIEEPIEPPETGPQGIDLAGAAHIDPTAETGAHLVLLPQMTAQYVPVPDPLPPPISASRPEPVPVSPAATVPATPRRDELLRGRYRITEILRRDSSGVLAEAVDEVRSDVPGVRRRISIQLFDAKGLRNSDLLKRVYQLQSLSHPCIQRVFDVDADQGEPFMTLESLTGMSLEQFLSASGGARLDTGTASTIIRAVASALAYAHSRDVCHGDVCAANVFITEAGEVRLRGFEMRGRDPRANVADDRLAFAWLAYELLAGLHVRGPGNVRRNSDDKLRQPPGATRDQWRVLHDALLGKDSRTGNVLTTFAGDCLAMRVSPLNAFARGRPRRAGSGRIAMGFVAAVALLGVWLFVDSRSGGEAQADSLAQPAAAVQPAPASAPARAENAPAAVTAVEPAAPAPATTVPAPRNVRARLDFPTAAVEVVDDQPFAIIPVRRRDNLNGTVTFRWWTETGSAEVNRDFLRIQPRTEMIADGDGDVKLRVPLLPDPGRQQPLTFYVKIDAPGTGATLGSRTLTQVTIYPKARLAQVSP